MDEQKFFENKGIEIIRVIAEGGYGTVYLVFHAQFQTYFALKKIPQNRFKEAEIECLKKLDQTNIINLYEIYKFSAFVYLLMEYCPTDLTNVLQQGELNEDQLCKYCHDILLAIKSCHDNKIAHNDIKPSNFLIDKYGRLKAADFGLSSLHTFNKTSNSFTGTTMFMAPEILERKEFDPFKSDIWAIGVTFYYLATQGYPFTTNEKDILLKQIQNGRLPLYNIDNTKLQKIVKWCLSYDPENRPTVDQLLETSYFSKYHVKQSSRVGLISSHQSHGILIFRPSITNKNRLRSRNSATLMKSMTAGSIIVESDT